MEIVMERIADLLKERKINALTLMSTCNLNSSAFYKWKKGDQRPSADAIVKIADFFSVSTDYLLGRTDNPHPNDYIPKNPLPLSVLKNWELLAPHEITTITTLIENLANAHK